MCHPLDDVGASIASGSFKTEGMVVMPCGMRTLAAVANGISENLLTRAADVMLKERRKLLLVARESPLGLIYIRDMQTAASAGATILPPMMTFYNKPSSIKDMIRHVVGIVLDIFRFASGGLS